MAEYNVQPEAVKRFAGVLPTRKDFKKVIEEIQKIQDLDQQYLVPLLEIIDILNEPLRLVMECGIRRSLFCYLRLNQEMLWSWRLRVAEGLARGLAYLHDEKVSIVHRDIKSPNVVLDRNLHAQRCDFGLATFKKNATATTNGRKGTMDWMAPELFQNNTSVFKESDIASFGKVLFELAVREVPCKGLGGRSIFMRLTNHQPIVQTYATLCLFNDGRFQRTRAKERVTVLLEMCATYVDQAADTGTEGSECVCVGLTMG